MSKNFFFEKNESSNRQPPRLLNGTTPRDPPRIIEKFHEMITEELFNIIWQHSDNHDDLSFIQFPKKDIFVWPQKHINLKIPRCIGIMRYQVLALHESCNDVSRYQIDSSSYDFSILQSMLSISFYTEDFLVGLQISLGIASLLLMVYFSLSIR